MESYEKLNSALIGLEETHDLLKEDYDDETFELSGAEYSEMGKNFDGFEVKILLSHEYDHSNVVLGPHPGAGRTESYDQADMLCRMYSHQAGKKGSKVSMLDHLPGDETGTKSVTFLVEGGITYGYLKTKKGVYCLMRISSFNSGGRRHTSFVSLDIMPQFGNETEIEIKPEDLIVETEHASGTGGQHINKTDSAVRIVHKPIGLVATYQNGRGQHENREETLRILENRLYQRVTEGQETRLVKIKGEQKANEWDPQIRSYVLHPYPIVKDHRTNCETNDVQGVMDGDLDAFIFAYLETRT